MCHVTTAKPLTDRKIPSTHTHTYTHRTVITMHAAKNGMLTTFIDGQKKNSVRSLPVCNALVDLYLDRETITKDLRADTLGNMANFLSHVK